MTADIFPTLAFARPNSTPEKEVCSSTVSSYTIRSPTINRSPIRQHQSRHGKGLSLSFPILLPPAQSQPTCSPEEVLASPFSTAQSLRGSPNPNDRFTFPAPIDGASMSPKSKHKSGDFLTMLAAQERKVLELKEELNKAENELTVLKKQWAVHEAGRKKSEGKNTKKLQPLTPGGLNGLGLLNVDGTEDKIAEERKRRKALIEMSYSASNSIAGGTASQLGRRGSKRVFEGRHARALSLLSPPSRKQQSPPMDTEARVTQKQIGTLQDRPDENEQIAQMLSLDGILSTESLTNGLGKTYKDLAAHRKSLPPVAADLLVKQGKQMVDGVREGFWTFFEDIRQAAVGEEGVPAMNSAQPTQSDRSKRPIGTKKATATQDVDTTAHLSEGTRRENSFWSEFGLETPERKVVDSRLRKKRSGHMQKKASTDSQNPPDLLIDIGDADEDEEDWEPWTTPISPKHSPQSRRNTKDEGRRGADLPWPELKKLTPSKLTRTVSDLMRDWESTNDNIDSSREERCNQMLGSPHV